MCRTQYSSVMLGTIPFNSDNADRNGENVWVCLHSLQEFSNIPLSDIAPG